MGGSRFAEFNDGTDRRVDPTTPRPSQTAVVPEQTFTFNELQVRWLVVEHLKNVYGINVFPNDVSIDITHGSAPVLRGLSVKVRSSPPAEPGGPFRV